MAKKSLNEQMKDIMRLAEEAGLENNGLFVTTFERYQVQMQILDNLKQVINEEGMIVSKEYVKGRKNLYTNPAVSEYNRTTDSANKTVATLMRILKNYGAEDTSDDVDPLMTIINGD